MPSLPLVNKKRVKQVKTPKTLKTDKPMPINSTETTVNKPTKEAWPSQPAELMLSSTHDESRYSLLDLPREIRQEIFGYLLPYTKPDDEEPSGVVWVKGSTTLLPVCRQLYGEYACFMYLKNTWCFTIARNTVYMRTWVQDNGKVTKLSGRLANVKTQLLEYMKNVVIRIELTINYTNRKNPNFINEVQAQVANFVDKVSSSIDLDTILVYVHDWHGRVEDVLTVLQPFHKLSNLGGAIQVCVAPLWTRHTTWDYDDLYGQKQPQGKKDKRLGDGTPWFEETCRFAPGGKMDGVVEYFTSRKDTFERTGWW